MFTMNSHSLEHIFDRYGYVMYNYLLANSRLSTESFTLHFTYSPYCSSIYQRKFLNSSCGYLYTHLVWNENWNQKSIIYQICKGILLVSGTFFKLIINIFKCVI